MMLPFYHVVHFHNNFRQIDVMNNYFQYTYGFNNIISTGKLLQPTTTRTEMRKLKNYENRKRKRRKTEFNLENSVEYKQRRLIVSINDTHNREVSNPDFHIKIRIDVKCHRVK